MKKWLKGVLNFIQVNIGFGFDVPAKEALQYFSSKGLKGSFSYVDVFREEHASAFTVAKMMDMDLLKDVQDSLHAALAEGLSFDSWKERIVPTLQANGWWGRQAVYDPVTGKTIVSQLGSPHRLEVIFRTNMQMAYSVGQWQQIMAQAEQAPYLMYDAVDDYRTRPEHRAWNNIVLRVDNPWWRTHYPPNGWLCRCGVIQLSDTDLEVMGLSVSDTPKISYANWQNPRTGKNQKIPEGIDPGFNYNPGILRYDELQKLAKEKASKLPDNLRLPAEQSLKDVTNEARKPINLDAGAGSGAIGRFAELEGELSTSKQTLADAKRLTGLPVDAEVIENHELPFDVPMRYNLDENLIEINPASKLDRGRAAQAMAEELLHATDHLGDGRTLSAGSALFDMEKGSVMLELQQHYGAGGYFKEFFDYPFHPLNPSFTDDRIKAESFARLGVLYFAEPDALKRELPRAFEVFHELFGLSKSAPHSSDYVRTKIWTPTGGRSQDGEQLGRNASLGAGNTTGTGQQQAGGLAGLREAIARVIKSPIDGKKANL